MFEALHRLAGNPDARLRSDEAPTHPLPFDGRPLVECLKLFATLCYTLHTLVERASPNLTPDYHPHQTVVASSELLRELACLAFQIEPYFSEPEDLEVLAEPLMPEHLPIILPIEATDFQTSSEEDYDHRKHPGSPAVHSGQARRHGRAIRAQTDS